MTTQQLSERITLKFRMAGHYTAIVIKRGKEISILVTDMTKIDAIKSGETCFGTTKKQALKSIWDQV
jgi:hypothetical protein